MDTLTEGISLKEIIRAEHLAYTYPGFDDQEGVVVFEDMNITVEGWDKEYIYDIIL